MKTVKLGRPCLSKAEKNRRATARAIAKANGTWVKTVGRPRKQAMKCPTCGQITSNDIIRILKSGGKL